MQAREIDKKGYTHTERQRVRKRQREEKRERQRDRETNRDRETETDRDRQRTEMDRQRQRQGDRQKENNTGPYMGFRTSNPIPNNRLPPTSPHLLVLLRQFHSLVTTLSTI